MSYMYGLLIIILCIITQVFTFTLTQINHIICHPDICEHVIILKINRFNLFNIYLY